jgi:SAM-dependent methyltransferase
MQIPCPICAGACFLLDVVDFHKSSRLYENQPPPELIPISYFLCEHCGFCFAPEFSKWRLEDFESKIYNSEYVLVDPDYVDVRPRANARHLAQLFGDKVPNIRHLDYGGGDGLLSEVLRKSGWQSSTYDPFVDRDIRLEDLGKFGLITAYEVFEHVPDVMRLISDLSLLLDEKGTVLFSTLLSDGNLGPNQPLTWWYAKPRNGHISLFSRKSLSMLGAKVGFNFFSFSPGFHAFCRHIPPWAVHAISENP